MKKIQQYNESTKSQTLENLQSSKDIQDKELANPDSILSTENSCPLNILQFLSLQMFHMTHEGTTFDTLLLNEIGFSSNIEVYHTPFLASPSTPKTIKT